MKQVQEERESVLAMDEGETLTTDDLSDIYIQVMGEHREKQKFHVRTRDAKGEFNDYLELRRPFGTAQ